MAECFPNLGCDLIYYFGGAISSPQWGTPWARLTKVLFKGIVKG